jgi:hypothetical protein
MKEKCIFQEKNFNKKVETNLLNTIIKIMIK